MTGPSAARLKLGIAVAALVLAADQVSKFFILHVVDLPARGVVPLVPGLLDFAMVWNHGVTFGLLQARGMVGQLILAGIAMAVIGGLLLWLRRAENRLVAASLGAIAGGALGNVLDRARYGMVADFIHVHLGATELFPWVFNIGDSAIVVGVGALLLESFWAPRARLPAEPPRA